MKNNKTRTSIVIDKELKAKVEEIAKKENRSFANMVNTALIKFVENYNQHTLSPDSTGES